VSPECQAMEDLKVVVFRLAEHEHAVDVRQVKEILINAPVSHVLEAPDFVEGVIKLRGRIVPVIDLRKRLHLPAIQKTRESCIIVARFNNKTAGFVVDSASELLNIPSGKIEAPTEMVGGIHTDFIRGLVYLDTRFLVILDLDRVLTTNEQELVDLKLEDEWEDETEGIRRFNLRRIIAFEMDDELYGAYIGEVAEIIEMVPIMPLPNVPAFILGLVNLRGAIVPVIDLRIRFGLAHKGFDINSRIIILKAEQLIVGIVVDRLWELLRIDPSAFQPPPPDVAKIDPEYFKEVTSIQGRMLIMLDIHRLLTETARKPQQGASL
jgi:purine-binding chemotaxis protein CheW